MLWRDMDDWGDWLRSRTMGFEALRGLSEGELRAVRGFMEFLMASAVTEHHNQQEWKHADAAVRAGCCQGACAEEA